MNPIKKLYKLLGPGIITGSADDDPSGIATYSQAGAQFGYALLWTTLFMLPLMLAVQEACARIGAVTGKGIAAVVKTHYSKFFLYPMVFLVVIANTINIGADLGAMAAATKLIIPLNFSSLTIFFSIFILMLEVFISYKAYARILKWLCLFLLVYPLTVFLVKEPWWQLVTATLIPHLELNFQFLFLITGVLGTTISPYLFFWQASEEVEETRAAQLLRKNEKPQISAQRIRNLRIDNFFGMFFSELAAWSIMVVTATVLHAHGVTDIKTAADAAKALEPFVQSFPNAGYMAKFIFAIGIIGLGLLSVPILAGSAAYALSEALSWRNGLDLKFKSATGFYGIIIAATLFGLSINFIKLDPIKALVYAAVINGIVAVPLIFIIALIAQNKKIMGIYSSGLLSKIFIWLTFLSMLAAAASMLFML